MSREVWISDKLYSPDEYIEAVGNSKTSRNVIDHDSCPGERTPPAVSDFTISVIRLVVELGQYIAEVRN